MSRQKREELDSLRQKLIKVLYWRTKVSNLIKKKSHSQIYDAIVTFLIGFEYRDGEKV